jgi:hypothetical protein
MKASVRFVFTSVYFVSTIPKLAGVEVEECTVSGPAIDGLLLTRVRVLETTTSTLASSGKFRRPRRPTARCDLAEPTWTMIGESPDGGWVSLAMAAPAPTSSRPRTVNWSGTDRPGLLRHHREGAAAGTALPNQLS